MIIFGEDLSEAYFVLGLNAGADPDEIKKAYRKKAAEFHPDKHGGDEIYAEKFKKISEAYELLTKSREQRRQYGRSPFATEMIFFQRDIRMGLPISLEEAYLGCKKEIRYYQVTVSGEKMTREIKTMIVDINPKTRQGQVIKVDGVGNKREDKVGDVYFVISYPLKQGLITLRPNGSLYRTLYVPWGKALNHEKVKFNLFPTGPEVKFDIDGSKANGFVYELSGKGFYKSSSLLLQVIYEIPKKIKDEDRDVLAKILAKYSDGETI